MLKVKEFLIIVLDVYKRQIILSVNNAGSVTLASVIQNAINIPNKIICFFMSAKFVVLSGLWYLFKMCIRDRHRLYT